MVMKKNKKWLVGLLLVVFVGVGLFIGGSAKQALTKVEDEAAYQQVMEQDVAYLYFGRDTCSYCRDFKPLLENAIDQTGTQVFYYDTDAHKNDKSFQTIMDANEVLTVPKLVRLEKGKITGFVDHTHRQTDIQKLLAK